MIFFEKNLKALRKDIHKKISRHKFDKKVNKACYKKNLFKRILR